MTETLGDIRTLMQNVLGHVFLGSSWNNWKAVLSAAYALEMTAAERAVVCDLTRRSVLPSRPVRELWLLLGRRAGKSIIAALIAVFATTCVTYRLAPGEVGVFIVIAADRKQARVIKRYISGLLAAAPSLAVLVARETADAIFLANGLVIEIHTASFRSLRGYTCIGACCDEVSFWSSEDSANPDTEVLTALRAGMASVPEAMLIGLTTLYRKFGEVGRVWDRGFARDDSESVLVANAPTRVMNPTIDQAVIDAAYSDDPVAAASEYGGQFRSDVESLLTRDAIAAVTMPGREQLPPVRGVWYSMFVDPAGGSGTDSFTAAVAHYDAATNQAVLDLVFERKPPFSPEQTVEDIALALAPYHVAPGGGVVVGDHYAGEWPREQFAKHALTYRPSLKTKSDLYRELVPLVNSKQVQLLDVPRLAAQLAGLERKTARGGRDSIDHGPGAKAHDDVSNAAAGALVEALAYRAVGGVGRVVTTEAARDRWAMLQQLRVQDPEAAARLAGEGWHVSQFGLSRRMAAADDDDHGRARMDFDPFAAD